MSSGEETRFEMRGAKSYSVEHSSHPQMYKTVRRGLRSHRSLFNANSSPVKNIRCTKQSNTFQILRPNGLRPRILCPEYRLNVRTFLFLFEWESHKIEFSRIPASVGHKTIMMSNVKSTCVKSHVL